MTLDELRALANKGQRSKHRQMEAHIQTACVNWYRLSYPKCLIFAVPNGGSRNKIEAANLKREGALAGVADLILLAEGKVLFVEMKTMKGRQTEKQKLFQRNVERLGFQYVVCRSFDEFRSEVTKWLIRK